VYIRHREKSPCRRPPLGGQRRNPMPMLVAVFIVSVPWLCPMMSKAGTPGEQPPEQRQTLTKDHLKQVQERLKAERVYAGPVDGVLSVQTAPVLRT
jgi:hypothetical protein